MESLKMVDGSILKYIPEQFGFAFTSCDNGRSCAMISLFNCCSFPGYLNPMGDPEKAFQPKVNQGDLLSSSFLNRLQKAGYIACSNSVTLLTKGQENMKCQS